MRIVCGSSSVREGPTVFNRKLVTIALANGTTVSTLYWVQSLPGLVAEEFGRATSNTLTPAATLMGYAMGVAGLAALAKELTGLKAFVVHLSVLVAALCIAAAAPTSVILFIACLSVGAGCALTQRLLCCATHAAEPGHRAQTIGWVIAAGLCGIVVARSLGPTLAGLLGWRGTLWANAVVTGISGLLAAAAFTESKATIRDAAPVFASNVVALWHNYEPLRCAAVQQAATFAAFNMAWAGFTATTRGAGPMPIVKTALITLAGAGAALVSGRCCDKRDAARIASIGVAVIAASGAALVLGPHTFVCPYIWMTLIDGGTQTALVANQARVQALATTASMRGRLAAMLTTIGFAGGAAGSACGFMLAQQGYAPSIWIIVAMLGILGWYAGQSTLQHRNVSVRVCSLDYAIRGESDYFVFSGRHDRAHQAKGSVAVERALQPPADSSVV